MTLGTHAHMPAALFIKRVHSSGMPTMNKAGDMSAVRQQSRMPLGLFS